MAVWAENVCGLHGDLEESTRGLLSVCTEIMYVSGRELLLTGDFQTQCRGYEEK